MVKLLQSNKNRRKGQQVRLDTLHWVLCFILSLQWWLYHLCFIHWWEVILKLRYNLATHRVWASSRSWWWTGKPDVLKFMGSERVGHDWASDWSELNWKYYIFVSFSFLALELCIKMYSSAKWEKDFLYLTAKGIQHYVRHLQNIPREWELKWVRGNLGSQNKKWEKQWSVFCDIGSGWNWRL